MYRKLVASIFVACVGAVSQLTAFGCDFDPYSEFIVCARSCRGEAFVNTDFLAWKACIDDLDYAVLTNTAVAAGATASGGSKFIDHGYQPGLRISGGVGDLWCGWGLTASYTYISDDQNDSVTGSEDATVHPTWVHGGLLAGDGYIYGSGQHKFRYQSFDLLWCREWDFWECYSLVPFFGVEYLSIDRNYSASFRNQASITGGQGSHSVASMSGHADYRGFGFKAGTECSYFFGSCLEFYGTASGTLTAGTRRRDTAYSTSDSVTEAVYTLNSLDGNVAECVCVPGWHLGGGFRYRNQWCGHEYMASIGYEFIQWLHAPQIKRYAGSVGPGMMVPTTSGHGSLAFHGVNLGFGVVF